MIRAFLFDLDGTLVQTEKLKAESYALAVDELTGSTSQHDDVVEHYKEYVGLTRQQIATGIMNHFKLGETSVSLMDKYDVGEPWEAFVSVRLDHYEKILGNPEIIIDHKWPRSIELLNLARTRHCVTALATMSHRDQAMRVLEILGLESAFDSVATVDDVKKGKPDPEIYLLTADRLDVDPKECIVLEDSPAGVQAALAAGMYVVAVATPFSGDALEAADLLPSNLVVKDHDELIDTVNDYINQLPS